MKVSQFTIASFLGFCFLLSSCATPLAPRPEGGPEPTAACFAWVVDALASNELQGRRVGSEGLEQAALFLEQEFRALGLEPAQEGYRQPFQAVSQARLGRKNAFKILGIPGRFGTDFVPLGFSPSGAFSGSLVFVGYGIRAESLGYDDYAGVDVTGKVVLALRGEPGPSDEASPFDGDRSSRWSDVRAKAKWAHEAGARALLLIDLPREGESERPLPLFRQRGSSLRAELPVLQVNGRVLLHLLGRYGHDLKALRVVIDREYQPQSFALASITMSGEVDITREEVQTDNILGVLPGHGALADEVVVIGASYDHLGMGGPGSRVPDASGIHNGADDNASGVAAMVCGVAGVAQDLKDRTAARRTLVVAAFSGGELGNAGSHEYSRKPHFPLAQTVAMLGLDRVGRLSEGSLKVQGSDSAPEWDEIFQKEAREAGWGIRDGEKFFGSSDPNAFYARGVPVSHLTTGEQREHHTPDDTRATIDATGGGEIADLVEGLLMELLTRTDRLSYRVSMDPSLQIGDQRETAGRAYLGTLPDVTRIKEETGGVLLASAIPGSPAETAGLRGGDRIVGMAGIQTPNIVVFTKVLLDHEIGERTEVMVRRDGKLLRFWLTLGSREGMQPLR